MLLDKCTARDISVQGGSDKGFGQGRRNDGHCIAKVDCTWSFYTNDIPDCDGTAARKAEEAAAAAKKKAD